MVNQPHAFYLRFFLNKGCNVLIWNYRGYGRTKGSPSPDILKTDGEDLVAYCKNELKLSGKIGVYGRSLGGTVAAHLTPKVEMVIADRTFSNLDDLSEWKFFSKIAKCFL